MRIDMTDKPITATDIAEKQRIAAAKLQRLIDEGIKTMTDSFGVPDKFLPKR